MGNGLWAMGSELWAVGCVWERASSKVDLPGRWR
jgi:hypothetical protein